MNKLLTKALLLLVFTVFSGLAAAATNANKPNIVLINMDNFGYGELGVYGGGITRGAPTPRIDALAGEGLRLTNFNVEAQCTPSRAALMTGRYAVRTGNASVPMFTPEYGLTQWEVTMAEMLSEIGYATGIFGKWHLGHTAGRLPTDQGFDEWYGIPNSSDESSWPGQTEFEAIAAENLNPYVVPEYIYEAKSGAKPTKLKIYNAAARLEIDREITDRAKDFMIRQVAAREPFFAYIPYTLTHYPVAPSKTFEGKSGNGKWGDVLMQIDAYVGELLDTVEQLGIANDTIFIFTADYGPEMSPGQHGWSGPWRGTYFTATEGSLRVPFLIRWPGKIPAGGVSNEIVHQFDLFTTLADMTGAEVPTDRVIDGVDQSEFFLGESSKSARDAFVVYVGKDIFGVKWRNWKMLTKEFEGDTGLGVVKEFGLPRFYNLYDDPQELHPWTSEKTGYFWVRWPIVDALKEHLTSLALEPPIKPGTPDPYLPAQPTAK